MDGNSPMICDRNAIDGWETFAWIDLGGGKVALQGSNGKYVTSANGEGAMVCDRYAIEGWEQFSWGTSNSVAKMASSKVVNDKFFQVYPNPSENGVFTVQVAQPSVVTITDLSGRPVYNAEISSQTQLSKLSTGTYILSVQSAKGKYVEKVVVK